MIRTLIPWIIALCLALLLTPAGAQEPNRAGVVIQYGNGTIESACVQFVEPEITGFELLERSGLPMTYDVQGGIRVCSIRGEGCDFPLDDCWCQCSGVGSCAYRSYHQLQENGTWRYAQLGSMAVNVKPGQVDGWRWGAGGANNAPPPADVTFESICAPVGLPDLPPTVAPEPPTPSQPPAATSTTVPPSATQLPPTASPELSLTTASTSSAETPSPEAAASATGSSAAAPSATIEASPTMRPTGVSRPTASRTPDAIVAAAPTGTVEENEPPDLPVVAATPAQEAPATGIPPSYALFGLLALVLLGGVLWSRREP